MTPLPLSRFTVSLVFFPPALLVPPVLRPPHAHFHVAFAIHPPLRHFQFLARPVASALVKFDLNDRFIPLFSPLQLPSSAPVLRAPRFLEWVRCDGFSRAVHQLLPDARILFLSERDK